MEILPYFDFLRTIIIDDRHDVWHTNSNKNLIKIEEYIFDPKNNDINDINDNKYEHLDALRDLLMNYKESLNDELFYDIIYEINSFYSFFRKLNSISRYASSMLKFVLENRII